MIVWGGNDAAIYKGDGGRYDPVADSWSADLDRRASQRSELSHGGLDRLGDDRLGRQ